jgi:hypothetical protein
MTSPLPLDAPSSGAMRFAYADPPYLGMGRLYADRHPDAMIWDDPETHFALIDRLVNEYPDGWALSLHEPSLRILLPHVPDGARVAPWVKPFAAFKRNVTRAWTWEPVIFYGGRPIPPTAPTWRDHLSESITMRKGFPGAKPRRFCEWVLDGLNWQPGDTLDDLFPGTGIMGEVIAARSDAPYQGGLFANA